MPSQPAHMPDVGTIVPLYHQLGTYLRTLIQTQRLQPGDPIPSEPQLAAQFRVSRATVRQAVDVLATAGIIRRVHGKGTFLTERVVEPPPIPLLGTVEEYLYRGDSLKTAVLGMATVRPPRQVAAFFEIPATKSVSRIARRRERRGEPLSYVLSHLRLQDGRRIEPQWLETESMLRILAVRLGLPLGVIQQQIEACLAPAGAARHLGVEPGDSILRIETRVWTRRREPVDFVETYFTPGYRYIMEFEWAGIVPALDAAAQGGRRSEFRRGAER